MLSENWLKRADQHLIVSDSEESKGLKTIWFIQMKIGNSNTLLTYLCHFGNALPSTGVFMQFSF